MSTPYREPEVPAELEAQRRFDARAAELTRSSAAQLATEERRRLLRRRALLAPTALCVLYSLGAVILRAFVHGPGFGWLVLSALAAGIVGLMSGVMALGMKVPPTGNVEAAPPTPPSPSLE